MSKIPRQFAVEVAFRAMFILISDDSKSKICCKLRIDDQHYLTEIFSNQKKILQKFSVLGCARTGFIFDRKAKEQRIFFTHMKQYKSSQTIQHVQVRVSILCSQFF